MDTIYKYVIEAASRQQVLMPRGSEVLTVQVQDRKPCLWVLVDTEQPMEMREFFLFGTGEEITEGEFVGAYIGTFQLDGGSLVFHLFARQP